MKPTTYKDYRERILRVLVHIQQNLDETLSIEGLARRAHFSSYHFHRIFTGMVGESVMEHVRRLRLQRAALRLKQTGVPVTQIAFDAGFETHEAFTRAFKRTFGEAPSSYRSARHPAGVPPESAGARYAETGDVELRDRGEANMDVEIREVAPFRVAFMRHIGPYNECGATWEKFVPRLGAHGLLGPDTRFIGVGHDDPEVTPPEKIRYDACVSVDEDFEPEGEIGVQVIGGGDYAVTIHHGPYDKLAETYAELCGRWLPRCGREARADPCMEIYLTDPENTEPEDLLTEIYLPLEPPR